MKLFSEKKLYKVIRLLLASFLIAPVFLAGSKQTTFAADPGSQPLLQQTSLVYQGSFRLPQGELGSPQYSGFNYGGPGLAYNPASDSLYIVGHDWYQLTAEVKIPQIVKSSKLSDLKIASVLQKFYDATDGKLKSLNPTDPNGQKVSGQLVYGAKLYLSAYSYYDGAGTQKVSHFVRPLDLSVKGQTSGPYKVGTLYPGFYSGYMALIPPEWQALFGGPALTGGCCHSIIGVQSSGPAVSVFNPADLGVKDPVPATQLVGYPINKSTLGGWGNTSEVNLYYNMSTSVNSVVFPGGTRTVLFFGKQGTGVPCYGLGTSNKSLDRTLDSAGVTYCYDPVNSYKGTHAYPYKPWVWAYNANDLLSVKNGQKNPWDIKPYGVWNLDSFFARPIESASYDPATGRIFVAEGFADGSQPLIHVFTTGSNLSLSPTPSPAPTPTPTPSPVPTPTPQPTPPLSSNTYKDGTLIYDQGTIYVMENGMKRGIVSMNVFNGLGYELQNVISANISSIPSGNIVSNALERHPRGTLILSKGTVYYMDYTTRNPYPSADAFYSWGNSFSQVVPANDSDLLVPTGPILSSR